MRRVLLSSLSIATCLAFAPAATLAQTSSEESSSVTDAKPTSPPVAEQREHTYTHHGITLSDPYHWLKDQSYPVVDDEDVLDYVKAENAWFEAQMAPHQALVDTLYEEMKARLKEDDSTVPQKDGDWLYWSEFEQGKEYRVHYRKPVAGGDPQLLLDENKLAEGKDYFRLGAFSISKGGRYLAYSADDNGSERYTARIKDLETGELLPDELTNLRGGLTWVANDSALVYGPSTEEWRTLEAKLHVIGTPVASDVTLYKEEDESFGVGTGLSAQEDWLAIATGDNETSEIRLVSADNPTGEQILVKPRQKGVEYDVDVRGDTLFVHTNDDHINFRL